MKLRDKITIGLLIGTAITWIGWDVILGATHSPTESMWIAGWVRQANSLALFLGALVGHWALQNPRPHYRWWPIALGLLFLVVAWDVLCGTGVFSPPGWTRYPGWWLLAGLPVGHWFWPQKFPSVDARGIPPQT